MPDDSNPEGKHIINIIWPLHEIMYVGQHYVYYYQS